MQERWFYFYAPQPNPKYHCQNVKRSVQRYPCWASTITANWWNSSIINSYWKQSSFRYLHKRSLEKSQIAFFEVRVFNPNAKRYVNQDISKICELNEKENKRLYNERIIEIEHGSFIPLMMSAVGGMSLERKKFYSRLAETISAKRGTGYNITVTWLRRKITFSFIKSIGICLRCRGSIICSDSWNNH